MPELDLVTNIYLLMVVPPPVVLHSWFPISILMVPQGSIVLAKRLQIECLFSMGLLWPFSVPSPQISRFP